MFEHTLLSLPLRIKIWLTCLPVFLSLLSYSQSTKPNIIYIMTDDMGYADLGCFGGKAIPTPHIDKLAAEGIKFINAYSAGAVCTPTRTAFMTGRYPARVAVGLREPLTEKDSAIGLTPDHPSIASLLKEAGYETMLIGKWHLGFQPINSPIRNGYDRFYGFHSGAADYISHKGSGKKPDLYDNDKLLSEEGYFTEMFTKKTIDFIKQSHRNPFFLTLNYNAPHWPWQAPGDKAYDDTVAFRMGGSKATYAAMMKSLDDGIGAVMKALDESGLTSNTIVIFTNDNGGERYSDNGIFSKGKASLWEGGIRVPAIVRWPGKINAGSITEQAAITMDWTATILAAAGAKSHPEFIVDGMNLLPVCFGYVQPVERTFYWRTFQRIKQKAIRESNWKYLQDEAGEYLFDLVKDPGEKNDLKKQEEAVFQRLKNKYAEWEKTVLSPVALN